MKKGRKDLKNFNPLQKFINVTLFLGVILLATFFCYFRLILRNEFGNYRYMLQWDMAGFMYPHLIFNSDAIRNFVFPLWNPYVYGGIPWSANFTSQLFQPMNMLIILIKGYSLELLQLELFITYFLAGLGMFFCLREFCLSKIAALAGAVSFLGCGFFVGNAQHFPQISTLAFLPLSFLFLNRVLNKLDIPNLFGGALSVALLASCGYPTMFALCLYVLFLFGVARVFYIDRELNHQISIKKIMYLLAFFGAGLSFSAVLLIPGFENIMLSLRTQAMQAENIRKNSLPLICFSNMWFPFLANANFIPVDIHFCLRNCSIGIIGFFFALYYMLFNQTRLKWTLIVFLTLSFILTLGTNTPLYSFLIQFIPFLKNVRHPAMDYRAIFLFLMCLFAGLGVEEIFKNGKNAFKKCLLALGLFVFTALMIINYLDKRYALGLGALVMVCPEMLLSMFFLVMLISLASKKTIRLFGILLIVFCLVETSQWSRFNFATIARQVENEEWIKVKQVELNRNRNLDAANICAWKRKAGEYPLSIKSNYAMFYKYFSDGGYEPLVLKAYAAIFHSPWGKIITDDFRVLPIYKARLFEDEKSLSESLNAAVDLYQLALINVHDIKNRTLREKLRNMFRGKEAKFSAQIKKYTPNVVKYEIKTNAPLILFFNEIYYPGWRLFFKEKEIPLFRINCAFRGAYLEKGAYDLTMVFSPFSFKWGVIWSGFSFLLLSCLLVRAKCLKKPRK